MFARPVAECNVDAAREQLAALGRWVTEAARAGTAAHEVELHLFRRVLALGAELFGAFLRSVGPGDVGPTLALGDGRTVNRLAGHHERRLATVFGAFSLARFVYGTREGQKIELVPTDQRLRLPEGDVSYLLQDWGQMLGVEQPFGSVSRTLEAILGLRRQVDTLERGSRHMAGAAAAAAAFRAAQPAPDPAAEGELLVVSEDNKGVPMVRPADSVPAGARRKKGEKANKKQMACVGCVYTVDRQVRTAEDLVAALFRDPGLERRRRREPPPPEACQKRYWAALTREVAGEVVRGQDEVFGRLADDVALRRRPGQTLLHLSDGQRSLEEDRRKYLPRDGRTVDILDLLHVAPRLWEAAHLFHREGSDAAEHFVRGRLLRVLKGEAKGVVAGLRRMGTAQGLGGEKLRRLRRSCGFLEDNLHRMRYDRYLLFGYPIATGVIEGACRHLVKDRMERAGMRWKVPGAQAMLELRAVHANGDWDAYQNFRISYENTRLYPHAEVLERIPWPVAA